MGKRISDFEGALEKLLIAWAKGTRVITDEILNHFTSFCNGLLCFVRRELTLGDIIREVLQNFFDLLLAFQDTRPKVSIRWNDDKVLGVSQFLEEFVLEWRQVWLNSTPSKVCCGLLEKVGDLVTKFDRDGS
jgi:hypothetical protein